MSTKIKTGISQAFWCHLMDGTAKFQPADIVFGQGKNEIVSWFDKLFEGGISIQDNTSAEKDRPSKPITFLISGPPGSGKTTLALEFCYRLAKNSQVDGSSLVSLYISTDTDTDRLINNAVDFGWEERYFIPFSEYENSNKLKKLNAAVFVWGRDRFQKKIEQGKAISEIVSTALDALKAWVTRVKPEGLIKRLTDITNWSPSTKEVKELSPDILIIDSLNIVEPEEQAAFFQQFFNASKAGKIVIFVLDSGSTGVEHKFWEYVCDGVVRLDYVSVHDYYVRTIEIVKARYQSHVWGKHQLKIYGKAEVIPEPHDKDINQLLEFNTALRRAHPYRAEGGIFIYPSIHYYLSAYKRKSAIEKPFEVETYPKELNRIVRIPGGRCTAFIGERGGHKSHLGYVHMLDKIINSHDESGLIISLREDESVTKETLDQIIKQEFSGKENIHALEDANRMEVLYYPPGYITPEEFFHRMFMSIHRMKVGNRRLTVLFNSLDQLSARFPLCAKQEIFIPGIIQALSGEGITSICIAVNEPGQPLEQYGLLPMADLILSFASKRFPVMDYYGHLNERWGDSWDQKMQEKAARVKEEFKSRKKSKFETTVLQVVRFAGGKRAGARGILELINEGDLEDSLYSRTGLHFTLLSSRFSQGE